MGRLLRAAAFMLPEECAHQAVLGIARMIPKTLSIEKAARRHTQWREPGIDLSAHVGNVPIANPIGLAAGFDKNGVFTYAASLLGMRYTEVGSVLSSPWPGNSGQKMVRLADDRGIRNQRGFDNHGASAVRRNLHSRRTALPVGVNIVQHPCLQGRVRESVEDIAYTIGRMSDIRGLAYFAIDLSCPNVAGGKVFQDTQNLEMLLVRMTKLRQEGILGLPLYVKLSPDVNDSDIEKIVGVAQLYGVDGYIAVNTTLSPGKLKTPDSVINRLPKGRYSGPFLLDHSLAMVAKLYCMTRAERDIIGVGGIQSGDDVYKMICAGANAVQLYTGLVYRALDEGPFAIRNMNRELAKALHANGMSSAMRARGIDARKRA